MAKIVIYTKTTCPYCVRAKHLLDSKNATYEEIITDGNDSLRQEARELSGGRTTVPQIFINGVSVGGCDELYAADAEGKLDIMIKE